MIFLISKPLLRHPRKAENVLNKKADLLQRSDQNLLRKYWGRICQHRTLQDMNVRDFPVEVPVLFYRKDNSWFFKLCSLTTRKTSSLTQLRQTHSSQIEQKQDTNWVREFLLQYSETHRTLETKWRKSVKNTMDLWELLPN